MFSTQLGGSRSPNGLLVAGAGAAPARRSRARAAPPPPVRGLLGAGSSGSLRAAARRSADIARWEFVTSRRMRSACVVSRCASCFIPLDTAFAYVDPLSDTADASAWWSKHSPVVTQTAALGPCDNTRITLRENQSIPGPNHQGFRMIEIAGNVIKKVHYVSVDELRRGFPMAWEGVAPPPVQPTQPPIADPNIAAVLMIEGTQLRFHEGGSGFGPNVRDHRRES